ncbi:tRNA lysidine(34) synthetase TilS [Sphingomonas sp. CARO-RG-8B-R24-01]|uniref:tRNA lysidine(34) synthetase TilS n=1 Tax=Sphingomonas sp. CARO-RG-8B-R24-01 TaxID=2914831 RepID=UPI001F592789|nr:tRNA lysidine(34) synthetase TilS [Sphingomonas sp. CARO-RG-8B-R24-01]
MTGPAGLDPAQVARFAADLMRTLGAPLADDATIGLAVSGGADSMAMLALANRAFPGRISAATVDHGLRQAAVEEAAMVAHWCATAAVPHRTLILRDAIGSTAIQATARALRYQLLGRWVGETGARALATAHHIDDQAETFLMRAVRGSGPAGLAGVRPDRPHTLVDGPAGAPDPSFLVIRPLLGWRRAELRAIVMEAGIPFADDPSNDDDHFERVRVRRLIADTPWLDPVGMARAASHAREAQDALDETAQWLWGDRRVAEGGDGVALRIGDVPRALQRLLVRRAILHVRRSCRITRPEFGLSTNIEPLLESLAAGVSATQGGVMGSTRGGIWRFRPEPPRRSP